MKNYKFISLIVIYLAIISFTMGANKPITHIEKSSNLILKTKSSFRIYDEVNASLISFGYSEISIPSNYVANISYNVNTDVLHLFYNSNTRHYVEVVKYANETAAETASGECNLKSKATSSGEECQESGNDCKVNVESGGTFTIICC